MTSAPDDYESRLASRLRSFVDQGVAEMPIGYGDGLILPGRHLTSTRASRVRTAIAIAGAVVSGLLVALVGFSVLRPSPPVGVKPTASPMPTVSPTATPMVSAMPTPLPTLPGETPGPTAVAPTGARFIPVITIDTVFAVAHDAGFSCQSLLGNIPDNATLYQLVCTMDDQTAGYSYVLSAAYWTGNRLNELHLVANPLGTTVDPVSSVGLFNTVLKLPFAESAQQGALSWFAGKIDGPGCAPCIQTFGQVVVEVQSSSVAGAASITVTGAMVQP